MSADPLPWRHTSGIRVSTPGAEGAPMGGFTYLPRHGYSDHADRYESKRWPGLDACAECAAPPADLDPRQQTIFDALEALQ